jgi:hypothetical protein
MLLLGDLIISGVAKIKTKQKSTLLVHKMLLTNVVVVITGRGRVCQPVLYKVVVASHNASIDILLDTVQLPYQCLKKNH